MSAGMFINIPHQTFAGGSVHLIYVRSQMIVVIYLHAWLVATDVAGPNGRGAGGDSRRAPNKMANRRDIAALKKKKLLQWIASHKAAKECDVQSCRSAVWPWDSNIAAVIEISYQQTDNGRPAGDVHKKRCTKQTGQEGVRVQREWQRF